MYKLIWVDDEEFALENYANSIDWNEYGFELIATFTNPANALAYINSNPVDAVISDIRMPHISGIELAEKIYNSHPNIIIVLLSGYQDFQYAKDALQYNVFDYLLKPINFTNLQTLCERLYAKLENNRLSKEEPASSQDNNLIIPQKIMSDFMLGKITDINEIVELLSKCSLNIDAENSPCAIINIEIDGLGEYLINTWLYGKSRLYNALNQLMIADNMYLIPTKYTFDNIEYIAISKSDNTDDFTLTLLSLQNSFIIDSFQILNLSVLFNVVQISKNLLALNNSNQIANIAKTEALSVIKFISDGSSEEAIQKLNDTISIFKNDSDFIKLFSYHIFLELSNLIGFDRLKENNIYSESFHISSDFSIMIDHLPEIIRNSTSYFSSDSETHIISKAKEYIYNHYMENITLTQVANNVFLSQSHFSRYFKKEVGENFIDYLNRVRINKAQEILLNSMHNVNEICYMVGYSSTTYFYKKFKSQTGYTAKEYRNKYSGTRKT